jgi:2-keto-3-deoxy-L-rhamnonate aldolase RhmA
MGVMGVMVPRVHTPDQAQQAVVITDYKPVSMAGIIN